MFSKFILFVLSTTVFLPIHSQGITGIFKGELTQDPNKTFYFEIRIDEAKEDGFISGTTYIESYGEVLSQKGDFGTIDFTGTWKGNDIIINEIAVVRELKKSSLYGWCIKKSILSFREENNEFILEGPWTGQKGCPPGTLKVKKATTAFEAAEFCMDVKFNNWHQQGKYETITDYETRTSSNNKELKLKDFKKECVCSRLDWSKASAEYMADSSYYKISATGFLPFNIYVPKDEAASFKTNFEQFTIDSIYCDLDYNTKSFKVDYAAVKDMFSKKKYTTKPLPQKALLVNLETLENTKVETKHQVTVVSKRVTIQVWDHNLIDGDIISLNLNGEWILESYHLQKEKKTITIDLPLQENILIMYAINLGSSPPNTASININDGKTEQNLVLNSDMGKSEAIQITTR